MKKIINFTLIAIACMAVACHKSAEVTRLAPLSFPGGVSASSTSVYVTVADTGSTVLTLKWPAVVYPVKGSVTYTIQADATTDTTGSTGWAHAASLIVGKDILTKSFTGSQLSTLAIAAGLTANDTAKLAFRIQSFQDRNAFSPSMTITVTPYASVAPVIYPSLNYPILYMPGAYQGWNPGAALTVAQPQNYYTNNDAYEGYIYMASNTASGAYEFKFTDAPDFSHDNYGTGGTPDSLSDVNNPNNLVLPGPGLYEMSANLKTLKWSATPITWAIIGDATPNGWGTETEMTFDPAKMTWSITLKMVTAGSFKFRANNAWNIDFGLDTDGRIYYSDNPIFGGGGSKGGLGNMTVPADGIYVVTLYLGDPNRYHFTAVKQ